MKCRGCNRSLEEVWYGYIDKTGNHLICAACWRNKKEIL